MELKELRSEGEVGMRDGREKTDEVKGRTEVLLSVCEAPRSIL